MKKLSYVFYLVLCLLLFSCDNECKQDDGDFRLHKVRHVNKSKKYWYYHNTPCDCKSIRDDLELDSHFGKEYRNYVEYYDNGEIVWGR